MSKSATTGERKRFYCVWDYAFVQVLVLVTSAASFLPLCTHNHCHLAVDATSPSRILHRGLQEERSDQDAAAFNLSPPNENHLVRRDLATAGEKGHDDDQDEDRDEPNETTDDSENFASGEATTGDGDSVDKEAAGNSGDDDGDEEDEQEEQDDEDEVPAEEDSARFKDTDANSNGSVDEDIPLSPQAHQQTKQNLTIAPDIQVVRGNITHPKIAWLMSFPNSGTSFTIHMTREASNTTTATNYAGEGDIDDLPSTPAIEGALGEQGPFLELIRGRYTNMPEHILTKTHCTGFCSNCGPYKLLFETPRSFMRGCLSGSRAVHGKRGLQIVDTMYDPKLVAKAIHIFRHPLDNTVARFHLEFNEENEAGNAKYVLKYPKNATGFQRWCARSDTKLDLFETRYLDDDLTSKLRKIPCFNEFFKYVQWHNMAFYTTHEMELDVLYLHYHEYEANFTQARDKVLKFLELPLVAVGVDFHPGKVYRHYYSRADKIAIREFIQEYATRDTWSMVKNYDFEIDTSPPEAVVAPS